MERLAKQQCCHRFVEEYQGIIGFGMDRETDGYTLTCYLQKFSDDELMALLRDRMSDAEIEALFDMLARIMKAHLTEEEYHRYFLKDHG